MDKTTRSFSIDEDIDEELSRRDDINASGLVNNYLREFLDATDATENEVIIREIERQISDIDEDIEKKESKKERLERRKERIQEKSTAQREEQLDEVLQEAATIPPEPDHPFVIDNAESLDMTPEDLAREIAETHGKEYNPTDDDDELRSL